MAAMKPRTGDGPLEATKEGRGIVMRIPSEGGGRLVIELTPDEASELAAALSAAVLGSSDYLRGAPWRAQPRRPALVEGAFGR